MTNKRTKFVALNAPDGDKPIKIVFSLERAVELCLTYKNDQEGDPDLCSVGKIFKPKFVFDKEKEEHYWTVEGERLVNEGEYYFIIDGLGYYPGNDYPIIKQDGWFHYTEIIPFVDITSLLGFSMDEFGSYTYNALKTRIYQKGKHKTMYARAILDLDKNESLAK